MRVSAAPTTNSESSSLLPILYSQLAHQKHALPSPFLNRFHNDRALHLLFAANSTCLLCNRGETMGLTRSHDPYCGRKNVCFLSELFVAGHHISPLRKNFPGNENVMATQIRPIGPLSNTLGTENDLTAQYKNSSARRDMTSQHFCCPASSIMENGPSSSEALSHGANLQSG